MYQRYRECIRQLFGACCEQMRPEELVSFHARISLHNKLFDVQYQHKQCPLNDVYYLLQLFIATFFFNFDQKTELVVLLVHHGIWRLCRGFLNRQSVLAVLTR